MQSNQYLNESHPKSCMSQRAMQCWDEMRTSNMLCDATITLDDRVIHVHRAIICACSEYFWGLFTSTLNGSTVTNVCIPGVRSFIMEKIVDYAYKRKFEIDPQDAHELLVCSQYFLIYGLVEKCQVFMTGMFTPANCVGMMIFSRARNFEILFNAANVHVLRNFTDVAVQNDILKVDIDDFFNIISNDMLNTKDEAPVWKCCLRWIDFDPSNRKKYIAELMSGIRLGLLETKFFMQEVKINPYVVENEFTRPLIIDTLTFLYDLDMIATRNEEMETPALAMPRIPHDVIFAIGGWSDGRPQSFIETYDTRADRWINIPYEDPAGPRGYHGSAVIGFKIYCIGGFDGNTQFNVCREFDAEHRIWQERAPMHCSRCYVSVAELNGLIYAMGGFNGTNRLNTVEKYDPYTNQWTLIKPMNTLRSDACACVLNNQIYITGGFNGNECMETAECYDPNIDQWTDIAPMSARRSGVCCISHKGFLYAIGGYNGITRMKTAEKYDPITNVWTPISDMLCPRSNFGIEILDDMIFVIGGFDGNQTISNVECYVPEKDEWLEATNLTMDRSALTANVIKGLPNIHEYVYQYRDRLMEEKRQKSVLAYQTL